MRVIAVDWSGAVRGAEKSIWLAEVRNRRLVRLESGRSRQELVEHLVREAEADPELVVGLDFAFSMPAWFLGEQGVGTARELWELVEREGKGWLARCDPPFWGRPGRPRPEMPEPLRENERIVAGQTGLRPKSVFQIGGAGAVGTGSLRGMPYLLRLAAAGYSVWPFDEPHMPLVLEIYPRLFTRSVVTSNSTARLAFLESEFPELPQDWRQKIAASEDAFDAATSALVMGRHVAELQSLRLPDDPRLRQEGAMWWPEIPPPTPARLQTALAYAAGLHAGQTRKGGEEIPYIGHLLGVCSLTVEAGGDEDQAIAALLHDAAEDQGGHETLEEIRSRFGERVARIVEACTDAFEDPKPAWPQRKERYLEHLGSVPPEALLVVCADKLYNARAILQDHHRFGDEVFDRFTADKEATLWYYRSLTDALARSNLESWLVEELGRTVAELERAARAD